MFNCPICSSPRTESMLSWDVYSINRCLNCKLIFAEPLPSDEVLVEYYQGFMFRAPAERDIRRKTKKMKSELRRLLGLTDQQVSDGKRLLDFGGGTGITYNAARELGFDAYYHDLDREAIAFVTDTFELAIDHVIEGLADTDIRFDCIIADNVIEHVQHPISFIEKLYDKLNDGGILVIKTPNGGDLETGFNPAVAIKEYFMPALKYNSLPAALKASLKRFWHCDPPRHLYSFSAESLSVLMTKLGVVKNSYVITYYRTPLFSNTVTEHIFSPHGRFKGIRFLLLRILALPVVPFEFILQSTAWILSTLKVISMGGLVLKIRK